MQSYYVWVDIQKGVHDIAFSDALHKFLGYLKETGDIAEYRIQRRSLGFGPSELGEWAVVIDVMDLVQLDQVFNHAAARAGELETLHAEVFSRIRSMRTALYRDFPDPVRVR
ncbi:MAG: hypothetical protein JNM85_04445 [Chthonomonas sp.]|nr:hypothetical protein [Chthonomonas sp.]